ncbi:Secreted protein OS=Streptomyces aurantiogriseus OX=66870 GN=GCM10010251_23800 PE=4 SV=1 [Streptomyces aurantiogriseus]
MLTTGVLVSLGGADAFADVLEDIPLSGDENTDQDGEQNLDCGNSARLVRLNVAERMQRQRVCVDDDGHTRRHSGDAGAQAAGNTTLGPQVNTAQTGKQNLNCGNSADLMTVNVLGEMNWDTTCVASGHGAPGGDDGAYTAGARTQGGTSVGPQINTAQTGRQNLYCGNNNDTVTVNALGTIRKFTTCTAADQAYPGSGNTHRGRATAAAGDVVGPETNTAQNGRQNQTCGTPGTNVEIPLGETKHEARCTAVHG